MTTQNWPDPTRPGVPMFPERKAWHMLDRDVWEWCPSRQAWNDTVLHPSFVKAKDMAWRKYHGPVLTPTQIAEMLEAERERCAKTLERDAKNTANFARSCKQNAESTVDHQRMAEIAAVKLNAAHTIRNLGAAP